MAAPQFPPRPGRVRVTAPARGLPGRAPGSISPPGSEPRRFHPATGDAAAPPAAIGPGRRGAEGSGADTWRETPAPPNSGTPAEPGPDLRPRTPPPAEPGPDRTCAPRPRTPPRSPDRTCAPGPSPPPRSPDRTGPAPPDPEPPRGARTGPAPPDPPPPRSPDRTCAPGPRTPPRSPDRTCAPGPPPPRGARTGPDRTCAPGPPPPRSPDRTCAPGPPPPRSPDRTCAPGPPHRARNRPEAPDPPAEPGRDLCPQIPAPRGRCRPRTRPPRVLHPRTQEGPSAADPAPPVSPRGGREAQPPEPRRTGPAPRGNEAGVGAAGPGAQPPRSRRLPGAPGHRVPPGSQRLRAVVQLRLRLQQEPAGVLQRGAPALRGLRHGAAQRRGPAAHRSPQPGPPLAPAHGQGAPGLREPEPAPLGPHRAAADAPPRAHRPHRPVEPHGGRAPDLLRLGLLPGGRAGVLAVQREPPGAPGAGQPEHGQRRLDLPDPSQPAGHPQAGGHLHLPRAAPQPAGAPPGGLESRPVPRADGEGQRGRRGALPGPHPLPQRPGVLVAGASPGLFAPRRTQLSQRQHLAPLGSDPLASRADPSPHADAVRNRVARPGLRASPAPQKGRLRPTPRGAHVDQHLMLSPHRGAPHSQPEPVGLYGPAGQYRAITT